MRERLEDIGELAEYFIKQASRRLGVAPRRLTKLHAAGIAELRLVRLSSAIQFYTNPFLSGVSGKRTHLLLLSLALPAEGVLSVALKGPSTKEDVELFKEAD